MFLSIVNLAYGTDNTVNQDIANSKNIDELIKKMNQAQYKDRYLYMNAIKQQLSSTKEREREEKIAELLDKIQSSKNASRGTSFGLGNRDSSDNSGNSRGNGSGGGNGNGGGRK